MLDQLSLNFENIIKIMNQENDKVKSSISYPKLPPLTDYVYLGQATIKTEDFEIKML